MPIFEDIVFPWINDTALGKPFASIRANVAGGAKGRVLEIGAGTGLNFRHYPEGVSVTAIEPAPGMRRRAEKQGRLRADITFIEGRAKELPFDAGSFDSVVITFTLCSIRDAALSAALAEVRRVLRKGGELRMAEHARNPDPWWARMQARVNPLWRIAFGGCSLLVDPRAELAKAGFDTSGIEDTVLPLPGIVSAGQMGVAKRD